jgi:hypothetical protein
MNLEPFIKVMRDAHKKHSLGIWAKIPIQQAEPMVLAVIEEYDKRIRQQRVLDIIDE